MNTKKFQMFLKNHEHIINLFFRVIEIFVIGIMINLSGNVIQKKILDIERIKCQPIFEFVIKSEKTNSDVYDTKYLLTKFKGDSFTSFKQEIKTMIVFSDNYKCPLYQFWMVHHKYDMTEEGIIRKSGVEKNFQRLMDLTKEIKKYNFDFEDIVSYINITYTDIFGEVHSKYYRIDLDNNVDLISSDEYKNNIDNYDKLSNSGIYLESNTIEDNIDFIIKNHY